MNEPDIQGNVPMKLLALDTSTEACSVALRIDGDTRERFELSPGGHGRLILDMARALLDEAGIGLAALDALAFGRGPGGFTGVRMATAIVQGLALGLDIPVVPVSSLAALAQGAAEVRCARWVLAALDARMDEVYWAAYRTAERGLVVPLGHERVEAPAAVAPPPGGPWWGAGSGWARHGERLAECLAQAPAGVDGDLFPRAAAVAALGAEEYRRGLAVPVDRVAPVYLRDKVVRRPGE